MWRYYALVWLVFVVKTEESPQIGILVEPEASLCLEPGRNISLTCLLSSSNGTISRLKNLSLAWYRNEEELTNATTTTSYTKNSAVSRFVTTTSGLFTCVGTALSRTSNSSVTIGMRPKPVHNLIATPKFIAKKDGFSYVMVSWLRQSLEYVYSLFYKIDLNGCFSEPCVDEKIDVSCNGLKCTALLDTEGNVLSDISFHIVTHHGACETRSKVWGYNLTLSSCGVLPPKTLFYIPFPPTKLQIVTSYRKVLIKWQDILLWQAPSVVLTLHCPETSTNRTTKLIMKPAEIQAIRLSYKDIPDYAPYGRCTFCLAIQEYICGRFSKPLCKTTRLSEEAPSKAPTITCTNDTCLSSYDKHSRNVTVTWQLPAEKYRGGILREIKVLYLVTSPNSSFNGILVRNARSNNVTVKLNKTLDYAFRVQACNREGCSSYSETLRISGIGTRSKYLRRTNRNQHSFPIELYLIISSICLIAFVVLVAACFFTAQRLRSYFEPVERSQESLHAPDPPDYQAIYDDTSYQELPAVSQSSASIQASDEGSGSSP